MISADITVARLLDDHPELVDVLAGYHPHFKALRNRLLRRVMAPRVTVGQAARMAGVPERELLAVLARAVGETPEPAPAVAADPRRAETSGPEPPPAIAEVPEARRVHLDVRDDIRRGEEPFARIMGVVRTLADDHVLVLRAPFEPIPLYDILGRRGFAHWAERREASDWSVWFYRDAGRPIARRDPAPAAPAAGAPTVLDVRGLEPPQPMVRVLDAIERLAPGAELEVRHDRRPIFLYPQLEERGCLHETDEPEPGLVRIRIRRKGP